MADPIDPPETPAPEPDPAVLEAMHGKEDPVEDTKEAPDGDPS